MEQRLKKYTTRELIEIIALEVEKQKFQIDCPICQKHTTLKVVETDKYYNVECATCEWSILFKSKT